MNLRRDVDEVVRDAVQLTMQVVSLRSENNNGQMTAEEMLQGVRDALRLFLLIYANPALKIAP